MLIDWFTVGAQVLNFAILVWLMKRFLYKPVLDAIDQREKQVADELADADAKKTEAQKDRDAFADKNRVFDEARAGLMTQATADAAAEGARLLDAARIGADALAAARKVTAANEAREMSKALRQRTQIEVFAVARQTLADLASTSLEASACEVFALRLRAIAGTGKDAFAAALGAAGHAATVRSAFDLPEGQRGVLRQAVNETFSMDVALTYETAPTLVSGIELTAQGLKFAWSIADYLTVLEGAVEAAVEPAPT